MSRNRKNRFSLDSINTKRFKGPKLQNYNPFRPVFSFHNINYGKKGCISICETKDKARIADRLLKVSQFTWEQIVLMPKEQYGFEKIERVQFKIPLPKTVTPEVELFVFRFSDAGRIAGYRMNDVFHIIAVGPNHNLY